MAVETKNIDEITDWLNEQTHENRIAFADAQKLLVEIVKAQHKIPGLVFALRPKEEQKDGYIFITLPGWQSFTGWYVTFLRFILKGMMQGYAAFLEKEGISPDDGEKIRKVRFKEG